MGWGRIILLLSSDVISEYTQHTFSRVQAHLIAHTDLSGLRRATQLEIDFIEVSVRYGTKMLVHDSLILHVRDISTPNCVR